MAGILASASANNLALTYSMNIGSIPGAALVPPSLLAAVGKIVASGVFASPQAPATSLLQRQEPVSFTLHEQGFVSLQRSSRLTVGQALASLGVRIGPNDLVSPAPEALLAPGLHIYVQHASRVELVVGGAQQTVYTHAATVGDLLAEAGIKLETLDQVSPGLAEPIHHGDRVDVTVIRETIEYADEPLPFDTVYRDDPDLLQGKEVRVQAGSEGYVRREYRLRHENGTEVSRELIGETTVASTNRIIARGTLAPSSPQAAPPGDQGCTRTLSVYATWYTAASAGGSGRTATGTAVYKGVVAVDPRVIPLGTRIYVPGYGYGVAADTGGAIKGNRIDLGYGPNDVFDWSTRWVDICILP